MLKYFRRLPIIGEKLKYLKPKLKDILYDIFSYKDDLTIIDVGANTGQTIDLFNRIFIEPVIYSFEPTPDILQILKKKYLDNNNIFLYDVALGEENCNKEFNFSKYSPTNSFLAPNLELYSHFNTDLYLTLSQSKKTNVKMIKFDDFYNEYLKDKIIDIFKIDTQGYEYNVLKGAINSIKNKTKLVYFEIQFLPFYKNTIPFYKIFELLYENNFYFYCWLPSTKKKYQILESDIIFLNKKYFDF